MEKEDLQQQTRTLDLGFLGGFCLKNLQAFGFGFVLGLIIIALMLCLFLNKDSMILRLIIQKGYIVYVLIVKLSYSFIIN